MKKLKFKNDKEALERLSNVQTAIDDYVDAHQEEWNEKEHEEFKELLKERAEALSEATGMKIHSLFD